MCFEPEFNIGDIISLIVGLGTLYIAWLVYKKLIPSELKKRQLDAVLDLLVHLNKYNFSITRYYHSGNEFIHQIGLPSRNFFNYQKLFSNMDNLKSFDELNILVLKDNTQPFDLSTFIENPLLPKEIAQYLTPFINPVIHHCPSNQYKTQDEILVFNDTPKISPSNLKLDELFLTTAHSLQKHKTFIKAIDELRYAIEKWCKSNNLDNLNFREANSGKVIN